MTPLKTLMKLNEVLVDNINNSYDIQLEKTILHTLSFVQNDIPKKDLQFINVISHTLLLLDLSRYSLNVRIKNLIIFFREHIIQSIIIKYNEEGNIKQFQSIYQPEYKYMFTDIIDPRVLPKPGKHRAKRKSTDRIDPDK